MLQWSAETTTRWMLAHLPGCLRGARTRVERHGSTEELRVGVYEVHGQEWNGAELLKLELTKSCVHQVIHTVFVSSLVAMVLIL